MNNNLLHIDGQQMIARKINFGYAPAIEEQRLFLAQIIDLLLTKERTVFAKKGGDIEAINFREEDRSINTGVGILNSMLVELDDSYFILQEPSFIKHMQQLHCYNWEYFHQELIPYLYWKKRG